MPCSPQQHSGVEAVQRVKSRALPLYPQLIRFAEVAALTWMWMEVCGP